VWKGGQIWSEWIGTRSRIADIAQLAVDLASQSGSQVAFTCEIVAPVVDAVLVTPDQIRTELGDDDLQYVRSISIVAVDATPRADTEPHRIRVEFTRTEPKQPGEGRRPPVVQLRVTGRSRDWVRRATSDMEIKLNEGKRKATMIGVAAIIALALSLLGAAIVGSVSKDDVAGRNVGDWIALSLLGFAGLAFVLAVFVFVMTPGLELIPDEGMSRWQRFTGRAKFSGRWLALEALGAVLFFVIGYLWGLR